MITVTLHCGRCSKETETIFDSSDDLRGMSAFELIKLAANMAPRKPWIVQDNGIGVPDTYCSKKCAL